MCLYVFVWLCVELCVYTCMCKLVSCVCLYVLVSVFLALLFLTHLRTAIVAFPALASATSPGSIGSLSKCGPTTWSRKCRTSKRRPFTTLTLPWCVVAVCVVCIVCGCVCVEGETLSFVHFVSCVCVCFCCCYCCCCCLFYPEHGVSRSGGESIGPF